MRQQDGNEVPVIGAAGPEAPAAIPALAEVLLADVFDRRAAGIRVVERRRYGPGTR